MAIFLLLLFCTLGCRVRTQNMLLEHVTYPHIKDLLHSYGGSISHHFQNSLEVRENFV